MREKQMSQNTSRRSRVLFIGPLPEPITGQSLACQVFLDQLQKTHEVKIINLSKLGLTNGVGSVGRVVDVGRILLAVARWRRWPDVIYFTISESMAGMIKDMLLYAICLPHLDRIAIHLHGGAGMRRLMLGSKSLASRLNRWFLRRVGAVIVLGPTHREIYAATVPAERLHIVPNFAQDQLFRDEAAIGEKYRERGRTRLLFLSNLIPGKGHEELLEAFLLLDATQRSRYTLDFAGGFQSQEDKNIFLNRIAGAPNIRYHGVAQGALKAELFAQAHVFCLPTYYPYEGQPISILEAYASGCVVLTTNHSGIKDVFEPGQNGYEVGTRSVSDIVKVLRAIDGSHAQMAEIALNNRRIAEARYRPYIYNSSLMHVIKAVSPR